jgi:hypothetical protein
MRIEAVACFPLALPEITTETDGSQAAVLVQVAARVAYDGMDLLQAARPQSGVAIDATPSA